MRVVRRRGEAPSTRMVTVPQARDEQRDESFLETLLAASPSMVFRLDADTLSVTYVSPNIGWLLGYSVDEVIGTERFWEGMIHPDERA